MTKEEIFGKISSHMLKGLMIHEQLSDYYDFLNLHGYKRCHEYHMYKEMRMYRKLHRYVINSYNMLIEEDAFENPNIIPATWYRYKRQEVDASTKRSAVKTGIEKWVEWERETKAMFETMYEELMAINEVSAAKALCKLLCDVDKELKWAERKHIDLVMVDYNISYIIGEQDRLHDWYKKHDKP